MEGRLWIYRFLIACIIIIALITNNASENLKKAYKNTVLFKFDGSLNSIFLRIDKSHAKYFAED